MTQPDLVSIVVVAYNNWPDLELAIQSALCQSYPAIEVIVVDNSSTDATSVEVQKRFGERIRYIRQANTGDAGAYNTGFRNALGDFVQFLDGDDVLTPHKVESQMEIFRSDPDTDIVYGDTRLFHAQEGAGVLVDTDVHAEADLLLAFLQSSADYFGNTLGFLLRSSALERVGSWNEDIYITDADFWLRALLMGLCFRYCPGKLMGFASVGPGKMGANVTRMLRGKEALWVNAMETVEGEPYRALILRNLARTRFALALHGEGTTIGGGLSKLSQARAADPRAVTFRAYTAGVTLLLLPGRRVLARSPRFRLLRHIVARLASYQRRY